MKKVSIITTFYNAESFIRDTLDSVLKQQTDKDFRIEYVLVDDRGTDMSRAIVEEYINAKNLNGEWRIVTPEQNLGCGGARRHGIENATGDFFMFLDADDYYIQSDFVLRAFHEIVNENADIVEYGIVYNREDGTKTNSVSPQKIIIDNNPHMAEMALFHDNLIKFNVWSKIYRRSIVESYTYSDQRTFEDVMTIPIWVANAARVIVMPTIEVNYRAASESIIRTDWKKTRYGTISAIARHFERWKDDKELLIAMYGRAMVDLEIMLNNHSSENDGFNEMSELNTKMLKYIYPDDWQDKVYEVKNTEQKDEKDN
jgi:glycosyltransferase involved in cell wall biosynthesis